MCHVLLSSYEPYCFFFLQYYFANYEVLNYLAYLNINVEYSKSIIIDLLYLKKTLLHVYKPNDAVDASIGLTLLVGSYCALHCTLGSGQALTCTGGHDGQGFGSGHLATGHLARGQGGHSPILHGLEQLLIHGGHLGTDDFNTYLDISGCAGHSVFNMYLVISGIGGHGGIVDFNTYFVGSGTGQGADGGQCSGRLAATFIIAFSICLTLTGVFGFSHLHFFTGSLQVWQELRTAGAQPQAGFACPHTLHIITTKPSSLDLLYFPIRYPPKSANTATNTNADIVYENLLPPFIPTICE